ncbi:MAG: ATP/GTP-binding protein [Planctomycetaceae bacterium]|nr:ATP/GTP-binding protein [Planctomycetaceae bacterium]
MLINFTVENFRSFGAEQTLNLVANKSDKAHPGHSAPIADTDQKVLRTALIYGANASGKSNLVKAMDFARDMILTGVPPNRKISREQFRFAENRDQPSGFEFRFQVENQIFVYGFTVTSEEVLEEWLSATNEKGKEIGVFDRTGKEISFGDLNKVGESGDFSLDVLKALEQLGTRQNQLLLNKIVDLDSDRRGELLGKVVWWFDDCLSIIEPESRFSRLLERLDEDSDFCDFVSEFLSSVSTGITSLRIDQTPIDSDKLPKEMINDLQSEDVVSISLSSSMSLSIDPDDSTKVIRRNLASTHSVDGTDYSLPFREESDGTQQLLHLLPALYYLKNQKRVFVIDEIDRSLHPLLSHAFLKFFLESCPGSEQQLIMTTHEAHLLDTDLLRRDEIWFTEKDDSQQTHLHSLSDMSVRKDLRLEKGYLQGRFGGIPFIGGMDHLKELVEHTGGV